MEQVLLSLPMTVRVVIILILLGMVVYSLRGVIELRGHGHLS